VSTIDEAGALVPEQLTAHEQGILEIALTGVSLAAIGNHEAAIDSLVERGLMLRGDKFNNWISPKGRALLQRLDQEEDDALFGFIEGVKAAHGLKEGDVNPFLKAVEE
jgi:hypothetical protein